MLKVHCISSGSCGNCTVFETERDAVIIDAGITLRDFDAGLDYFGVNPAKLRKVFITHRHSDHIKGAGPISRKHRMSVVADNYTLAEIHRADPKIYDARVMNIGSDMSVGEMNISSFATSHDTQTSCAYCVRTADTKVCLVTDTGVITPAIAANVRGSDLLILESNYDEEMLDESNYPAYLKHRIRSAFGHLSNGDAADFIADFIESGGENTHFWLAHLSRENNTPVIARARTCELLHKALGVDKNIEVALRDTPSLTRCLN
ncbi:MAG: MBL fold metallo-hydrolase [Abditibacteriota bacterium]|nr:MBL fold metallo-hydrolase [Abditibacteriota bacterium]MBP5738198.1 MBL fold metallo-hydrolase [Abditibacteriota bacterium]